MKEPQSPLPNFLLVGAAKSGTTSLYHYLKSHPQVFFSPVKEPCFFTAQFLPLPQAGPGDERKRFTPDLEDYRRLFAPAAGFPAVGEASADTLTYWERTIPLIRSLLGDPRILIILRHPVDRAYSAWQHLVRDGRETLSFEEGLAAEVERTRNNYNSMWFYRERGLYFRQVKGFQEAFSRVRVFLYDDLRRDPSGVTRQAFEFLEVDPAHQPTHLGGRFNAGGVPRWKTLNRCFVMKNPVQRAVRTVGSRLLGEDRWTRVRDGLRARLLVREQMKPETRRQLQDYFRLDILELQELIRRDLSGWLS